MSQHEKNSFLRLGQPNLLAGSLHFVFCAWRANSSKEKWPSWDAWQSRYDQSHILSGRELNLNRSSSDALTN